MKIKTQNKRFRFFVAALIFLFAFQIPLFYKPEVVSAEEQKNALVLIAEHCHDLKDLDHDFGLQVNEKNRDFNGTFGTDTPLDSDTGKRESNCIGWQEIVKNAVGCGDLFYSRFFRTDPNDSSVGETKWYTDQSEFKSCYRKALAQYNLIASSRCNPVKDDSSNWDICESNQYRLYSAVGCDDHMFQDANLSSGSYWKTKPGALASCKAQIDRAGKAKLVVIGSDGKPTLSAHAIESDEVPTGGDSPNIDTADCDPAFGLGWIACSASEFMANFAKDIFESIVGPMLENVPVSLERSGSESGAFKAWQAIRVIANALLVISLLAVVYAQAKGGD